jgi:two-component system, NtrC family, sensor histidine kinase HydH
MKRNRNDSANAAAGRAGLASLGLAIVAFALLTAFAVAIFRGMAERDRLEVRNDAERTMSLLLASLRDHDDFGSAIESVEALREKVLGLGAYAEDGSRVYAWGSAPRTFSSPESAERLRDAADRSYAANPKNDSLIFSFHPFRAGPAVPPPRMPMMPGMGKGMMRRGPDGDEPKEPGRMGFLFTTMRDAEVVRLEIKESSYWMSRRLARIVFPLVELALAAMVFLIRGLALRNAEYRRRIEEQKSLVVLGTAASTIAHEIKNPLLSIRLQTRILEKTCPDSARREIGIINDEVERLSALSHRVGDYLRDPEGNPSLIDPAELALEVGMRLCGRNVFKADGGGAPRVSMDAERLRSVLENLVRNALESGGPEEGVSINVGELDGKARIDVLDRGTGLAPDAEAKLFDPFFTTKSRGTGIGLSVCKRFVEAAGGAVTLSARDGGGCRARVLLPAAKGETA